VLLIESNSFVPALQLPSHLCVLAGGVRVSVLGSRPCKICPDVSYGPHVSLGHTSETKEVIFGAPIARLRPVGTLRSMPVMKITRQGLCSIAVLTAVLWGCIIAERLTVYRARANAYHALDKIHALQLRRQVIPVAAPAFRPNSRLPVIG